MYPLTCFEYGDTKQNNKLSSDNTHILLLPLYCPQVINEEIQQFSQTKKSLRKNVKQLRDTVSRALILFLFTLLNESCVSVKLDTISSKC